MKRKSKKAPQHKAIKISAGKYFYRKYRIEFFDYSTLGDPECNYKQWNIYGPGEENWSEYGHTLEHAKRIVDRLVTQAIEQQSVELAKNYEQPEHPAPLEVQVLSRPKDCTYPKRKTAAKRSPGVKHDPIFDPLFSR
jgi:hypothetical protein